MFAFRYLANLPLFVGHAAGLVRRVAAGRGPRGAQRTAAAASGGRGRTCALLTAASVGLIGWQLPGAAQDRRPPVLSCSPSVLRPGGTLTLHLAVPHPTELSIEAPDGTVFFLVYEPGATPPSQQPVVDKASFASMKELNLDVSTATAAALVYGRRSNEQIFREPGRYKVTLANDIQSDAVQEVYRCKVTLRPRP
jgi:hypothetical protein